MEKLLRSRTFWTVIVMFLLGGLQAVSQFMPNELYAFINTILLGLAGYFKLNPSQKY